QAHVRQFLMAHGLDRQSRQQLESWWNVQWSTRWQVAGDIRRQTLLQCSCGYHSLTARKAKVPMQIAEEKGTPSNARRNPYDFTGCLAHVEITERDSDGAVSRIMGYLCHNDECKSSVLKRIPAIPLHLHVYEVALEQLKSGASIAAIQAKNNAMLNSRGYHDMETYDPSTANYRYNFLPRDSSYLYHLFNKSQGINTRVPPQYNLHEWLDPYSSCFRPEIHQAVFHYSKRAEAGDRLKVCIATEDMNQSAWEYTHHSILMLDGTFGLCSSRLLLFIAMGVDAERKGVPLALFLFSAPTGSRATHAGYSTEILAELLKIWKTHLSQGRAESFTPYVAITDTDVKERGALLQVWPSIWLLLCRFHIRQCWTNRRDQLFKGRQGEVLKSHVHGRLLSLEDLLLNSVDYEAAQKLIEDERSHFTALSKLGDPGAATAARVGAQYLDYLSATWMPKSLWQGWSLKARMVASTILGVPVESIITTTNHLESFNHVLKNKYIPQWQHSGTHLQFDFLIHILIIRILPEIFATRRHRQQYQNWVNLRFEKYAGGANLSKVLQEERRVLQAIQKGSKACWWAADRQRDESAVAILRAGLLNGITRDVSEHQFEAVCYSTANPTSTPYRVTIHRIGYASCTCLDFVHRGGACKHLRALRIRLDAWVSSGHLPTFYYPGTPAAAKEIEEPLQPPALSEQGATAAIINNLLVLQDMAGVEDPEDGIGPAMPGEAAVSEVDEQGEGSKPLSSRCNLSTEEAEQFQTVSDANRSPMAKMTHDHRQVRRDWPFKSSSELNSS
ncbi:hypothetical protein NEOLEDRAFT_1075528, partial [Neolentinus lepideus HHB14362 ss-1]